jgi:hypothetical protein
MGKQSKKSAQAERLYGVQYLIVDSAPLLEAPLASLRGMAAHYLLTPDVGAYDPYPPAFPADPVLSPLQFSKCSLSHLSPLSRFRQLTFALPQARQAASQHHPRGQDIPPRRHARGGR